MRRRGLDPVVLEGCTIEQFLQFLLSHHTTPTNLIVCSTRDVFLQNLLDETKGQSALISGQHENDDTAMETEDQPVVKPSLSPLLVPTLRLLTSSRTVHVSFCPDITHLLAYLTVLPYQHKTTSTDTVPELESLGSKSKPTLAILDPIRLHRPTSSFSAQGFNRTFAFAIDTAHRLGQKLILVESPEQDPGLSDDDEMMFDDRHAEPVGDEGVSGTRTPSSPWDQPLSMLNVTTKTFGVGERGWVGRTVNIRQVAERWCTFVTMKEDGSLG